MKRRSTSTQKRLMARQLLAREVAKRAMPRPAAAVSPQAARMDAAAQALAFGSMTPAQRARHALRLQAIAIRKRIDLPKKVPNFRVPMAVEIDERCRIMSEIDCTSGHGRRTLREDQAQARATTVKRLYADLLRHPRRYDVGTVDGMAKRHVLALVEVWARREQPLARGTIDKLWATALWWYEYGLQKGERFDKWDDHWPQDVALPAQVDKPQSQAIEKGDSESVGLAPAGSDARVARGWEGVDQAAVLAALRGLDERAWWMARLVRELGLTVREATLLAPHVALQFDGVVVTTEPKGRQGRHVVVQTDEAGCLVAELKAWARGQPRGSVGWAGKTAEQARNRYNAMVRKARAQVEQGAASGASDAG